MTPEEALKVVDDRARYSMADVAREALRVLADALREAQAQTVQMTTQIADLSACMVPLPAARTYDDGVRDAAKAAGWMAEKLRGTVAGEGARSAVGAIEALLSPAPAVAPVAAPRPLHPADCAHDSTPEVSVPHMPDSCGFVSDTNHVACPLPFGHAGWRQTPPVAAPKPGPTTFTDATGTKWSAPAEHAPQVVRGVSDYPSVAKRFDAEAALVAMRDHLFVKNAAVFPTPEADLVLFYALEAGLAAGRGARS